MRNYILSLIFLCWSATTFAQDPYFVTVVKGSVTKKDGTAVTVGSKLDLLDKVTFATKESLLILLHPSKGRLVVSAANAQPNKENSFTLLIKDFLKMNGQSMRLSSRAINEGVMDLASYFRTDPSINNKTLIIDSLQIRLPRYMNLKPDNNTCYFFLQLLSKEPINHRLFANDEYLNISREDIVFKEKLYSIEAGELKLGLVNQYTTDNNVIKKIATINPSFITRETCASVIKAVKSAMGHADESTILKEVYMQLYYTYGKPDENKIEEIFNSLK